MRNPNISIYAYLFDAEAQDRQVKFDAPTIESVGENQLLWVDVNDDMPEELQRVADLLDLPATLQLALRDEKGLLRQSLRPRLDQYGTCFHVTVEALQTRDQSSDGSSSSDKEKDASDSNTKVLTKVLPAPSTSTTSATAFRLVTVHFIVFANLVISLHEQPAAFLDSFDRRIKGDTHLGTLDGPAFLGALLNWHITGYFRALEVLEGEVDRIDDAALRQRRGNEERNLLLEMVKVRRRLALIRRNLLPHREVYATLARPRFASFVTEEATTTLQQMADRVERAVEATEHARELILGSFDIFTTQTALRTNEVVKALTILSAILLPAGVIANLAPLFIRTPVYDLGRLGFWGVLASMVLIGVAFVAIGRKRNWM